MPRRELMSAVAGALRGAGCASSLAAAALAVPLFACGDKYDGTLPPYGSIVGGGGSAGASGGAGAAGSSGSAGAALAGAGGSGEPGAFSCEAAVLALDANAVRATTPRISLGKRIVASAGVTNAAVLVDGNYHQGAGAGFGVPTPEAPRSVSIELAADTAAAPARVLVVWKDAGWAQYTDAREGAPGDYHFEVSADSSDGVDGSWSTVGDAVTGNAVNNRGHALPFAGQRWLRMVVTAAPAGSMGVNLDEISVHDVSASPSGIVDDTWVFFGDSITQLAFRRDVPAANVFDAKVAEAHPARFPIFVNAGVGGDLTANGLARLDQALALNPDFKYFALGFGTNDSWGNQLPANTAFESNMRSLITRVRDAGRVPVLPRIPFANGVNVTSGAPEHETIPAFNAIVDALTAEFSLPCGPDLFQLFADAEEGLGMDGVHPNLTGFAAMNAAWAERVLPLYTGGD